MEQKNLFLLLKSALWNDELAARPVHDVDWGELYGLAKEQCHLLSLRFSLSL